MSLRVLVVDDEPLARERLRTLLASLPQVNLIGECANARDAAIAMRELEPDLVLLDVEMPEVSGLELAAALAGPAAPLVVIVSAHRDHAVEAFRVAAVDYVLKPFDLARLGEAVGRAQAVHELHVERARLVSGRSANGGPTAAAESRLALRSPGRISYVPLAELEWIDADGVRTVAHAGGRAITSTDSIQDLEKRLASAGFARIHRSTIVNLAHVRELEIGRHGDYAVLLSGGRRLAVGRSYRAPVRLLLSIGVG